MIIHYHTTSFLLCGCLLMSFLLCGCLPTAKSFEVVPLEKKPHGVTVAAASGSSVDSLVGAGAGSSRFAAISPRRLSQVHELKEGLTKLSESQELFSVSLWEAASKAGVPQAAIETQFVQGIKTGTLDPNTYGQYTVQDCAYCYNGLDDWQAAEDRARSEGEDDAADFAKQRCESYKQYNAELLPAWHIKDPSSLMLTETAQSYIAFERFVSTQMDVIYTCVAMLPCDKLWGWMADVLPGYPNYNPGIYKFWIDENASVNPGGELDSFIDQWNNKMPLDFNFVDWIFTTGLTFEVNMFKTACNEPLLPYPQLPPALAARARESGFSLK